MRSIICITNDARRMHYIKEGNFSQNSSLSFQTPDLPLRNCNPSLSYHQKALSFKPTLNSGLIHNVNILFLSNQSSSPGTSSISKCHSTFANSNLISAHARFLPMQFAGPTEKG